MNYKKKFLIVLIMGIIITTTSIPLTFFIISSNQAKEPVQVQFIPAQIKSYPNHTAWLLLDIKTKNVDLMSNLSLNINTNSSIDMDLKIWDNSLLSKVVEVFLYPNITHLNTVIEIEANVSSGRIFQVDYAKVRVIDWTSVISSEIIAMRDEFVDYLSSNHTNFSINESTIWEEFGSAPQILVVEHYLFRSEYWEMELAKHATIAPHDWVEIYLRPRSSLFPNWSGHINSWSSGNYTIIEVDPPTEIYR
ncbi:MAG: hypothetical protein R3255_00925 [Candidatus Lokiarchaeia archaeon]|nr:hypothetical protein [Candidatus Lokiarchaeia archaeon]